MKIGDILDVKVTSVETVLVANTIFLSLLLFLSPTTAKVMSEEIKTPCGAEKVAYEPTPSADPDEPLPATSEDTTVPPKRLSLLILFPLDSVTNAKVSSTEISRAYGA